MKRKGLIFHNEGLVTHTVSADVGNAEINQNHDLYFSLHIYETTPDQAPLVNGARIELDFRRKLWNDDNTNGSHLAASNDSEEGFDIHVNDLPLLYEALGIALRLAGERGLLPKLETAAA